MNEGISVLTGLIAMVVISVLKDCTWRKEVKTLLAFVVCVALGALQVAAMGTLDRSDLAGTIGIIFTAATFVYNVYFNNSTPNKALEATKVL